MSIDLRDKFIEAASKYSDLITAEDNTTVLHRTPWVRILLETRRDDISTFCIEVEVSLPQNGKMQEADSSLIFEQFTQHLQYLQKLRKHGFELGVVESGCIWCASKVIQNTPKDNLFRALIPP